MQKLQKPRLELELYPALTDFFLARGYLMDFEVPIHRNRIDMLVYKPDQTIAIELKLKNWKRARRQATYYQLGADLSYIAMPLNQAIELYKRKYHLEKDGIGLFAVLVDTGEVRELVEPKQSLRKIEFIENGILSLILHRLEKAQGSKFLLNSE